MIDNSALIWSAIIIAAAIYFRAPDSNHTNYIVGSFDGLPLETINRLLDAVEKAKAKHENR